jgi:hypothetical protein
MKTIFTLMMNGQLVDDLFFTHAVDAMDYAANFLQEIIDEKYAGQHVLLVEIDGATRVGQIIDLDLGIDVERIMLCRLSNGSM